MSNLPIPQPVDHRARKLRAIIFGQSGSGKTYTAASARHHPGLANILVANFDRGDATLPQSDVISVVNVNPNDASTDVFGAVTQQLLLPPERRDKAYQKFNTLVVDSISALRDQVLDEAQGNKARTYSTWNTMHDIILRNIDLLIQSGQVHIILLAGAKELFDQGTLIDTRPDLNPALWSRLRHRMDMIFYTSYQDRRYTVRTHMRDDKLALKIRNVEVADALAEHNYEFNRQWLLDRGVITPDQNLPREALAYSMIADDRTLTRFYDVYLKTVQQETK